MLKYDLDCVPLLVKFSMSLALQLLGVRLTHEAKTTNACVYSSGLIG